MARPGLTSHRKFDRLARILGGNEALALGSLELLWERCYQNGDPYLGDAVDVEAASRWKGESGVLCRALLDAGGDDHAGFIEEVEGRPGRYQCHDLFHHAPDYVVGRRKREMERRQTKECALCGAPFHSSDSRATYCSDACRTAAWRRRHETDQAFASPSLGQSVTDESVTLRHRDVTVLQCDTTPAPAPAPAPAPSTSTTASPSPGGEGPRAKAKAKPRGRSYGLTLTAMPEDVRQEFSRAWDGYPSEGWNFETKTFARRRLNQEGTAQRFAEILDHNTVTTVRGPRLTAVDLADLTLYFVAARRRHAERKSEHLNVPCIENFFSTLAGSKANPWQNAAAAWIHAGCPSMTNPSVEVAHASA